MTKDFRFSDFFSQSCNVHHQYAMILIWYCHTNFILNMHSFLFFIFFLNLLTFSLCSLKKKKKVNYLSSSCHLISHMWFLTSPKKALNTVVNSFRPNIQSTSTQIVFVSTMDKNWYVSGFFDIWLSLMFK